MDAATDLSLVPKLRFPDFLGEWKTRKLSDLQIEDYDITYGVLKPEEYVDGGFPMLQIKDVTNNEISSSDPHLISAKLHRQYQRTIVETGNIVLSVVGTIGKVAKIPVHFNGCNIHRNLALIKINKESSNDFVFQFLVSDRCQKLILRNVIGSTQALYNLKDLRKIPLELPTLPEQRKIADFLTAVDRRISQLVEKKALLEDYKKGVMQQLFTQAIRFKDDDGNDFPDWEEKKLGEVCSILKGKGISKDEVAEDGATPCIRYGELYTKYCELIEEPKSRTDVPTKELVLSLANDVIIPASGETHIDIATASCVMSEGIALGGDLNIIRTKLNGVFLAYYLNNACKHAIARVAQGSSVIHLYPNQLKGLSLAFPSADEQTKIADFLSAIDRKIESVATQITETKTFKRGLLQQMFV